MGWRLAKSLERLRDEVNALAPGRNKDSDGVIGDTKHQVSASDHNPNIKGVVCALDITHDPASGVDIDKLSDLLVDPKHRNKALKYVIANRLIAGIHTGWEWWAYNGSNPHVKHIHVSVGRGSDGRSEPPYDNQTPWGVFDLTAVPPKVVTPSKPKLKPAPGPTYAFPLPKGSYFGWAHWGNQSVSGWYNIQFKKVSSRVWLNRFGDQLRKRGWPVGYRKTYLTKYGNDGMFGDEWLRLARAFQKDQGLKQTGLIDKKTWDAAFKNKIT